MKFKFIANIIFEAEGIDDAFSKIEKHFKNMRVGDPDEPEAWFIGEMEIEPFVDKPNLK